MLTDFGLYKCEACGKKVMGFEKDKHADEQHQDHDIVWKKLR
jgi:DNA-directed RNA polymerase subunit RPC12/RpoP